MAVGSVGSSTDIFSLLKMLQSSSASSSSAASSSTSTDSSAASAFTTQASAPPPPPSAEKLASGVLSQIDTDGSSSISKDELETFAKSTGGTSDQADQILAALDSNGDDAVRDAYDMLLLPTDARPTQDENILSLTSVVERPIRAFSGELKLNL